MLSTEHSAWQWAVIKLLLWTKGRRKGKKEERMKEGRGKEGEREGRREDGGIEGGEKRREEKGVGKKVERDKIHTLDPHDGSVYIMFKVKHTNKVDQDTSDN